MAILPDIPLPGSIRSRYVENINGLRMHVLEAGFETRGRPCLLLLHGFPELAFSWRKAMPQLADAGYHVVAPDQRGYGRTTGWDASYDGDLNPFRLTNLVRDALGLVSAFGYRSVDAVLGHDFGSPVAAWCAPRPSRTRWLTKGRRRPRSPQAGGCRTASLRSTPANISAPDSRVACNGIAAARRAPSTPNCRRGRAGPSTCHPASFRESRIGARINGPAYSRQCRRAHAPT